MDVNDITKLLEAGKKDEAKKKLIDYLTSVELAPEEAGKVYADFASLYTKVHNEVLAKYSDFLGELAEELKALNERTKEIIPNH